MRFYNPCASTSKFVPHAALQQDHDVEGMHFTSARTTMRLLLDPTESTDDDRRVGKQRFVLRVGVLRAAEDIVFIIVAIDVCICMQSNLR